MSNQTTPTAKPWYKSKIILLCLAIIAVYGGNLLTGFITGAGITEDQINVIRQTQPQIADVVKQFQSGQNILGTLLGGLFPLLIAIVRKWWTTIPFLH